MAKPEAITPQEEDRLRILEGLLRRSTLSLQREGLDRMQIYRELAALKERKCPGSTDVVRRHL